MYKPLRRLFNCRNTMLFAAAIMLAGCGSVARQARLSLAGEGATVYAAGDIADCRYRFPADSGAAQTAALIAQGLARDPNAAVLTLGDNTYPVGLPAEFDTCYAPTWGRFKARTFPVPGNHEYYTQGAPGYYAYFSDHAGPAQRGYYSFTLGKWRVLALNSALRNAEFAAQLEWLKAELAQNKSLCTLAFWHHPVYSSGGHGNNDFMLGVWKELVAGGVDLALVGHDHDYERFAPQDGTGQRDDARGLRQIVVGTGGAQLTPLRLARPNSEVNDNSTHGVLKLVLKETGYEWEFLPVAEGGFTDHGAARCH
jgi:acid phosphatase type 7